MFDTCLLFPRSNSHVPNLVEGVSCIGFCGVCFFQGNQREETPCSCPILTPGCGSKNRYQWNPGKWTHGPKPAVCPSCLLSSTHLTHETPGAWHLIFFLTWARGRSSPPCPGRASSKWRTTAGRPSPWRTGSTPTSTSRPSGSEHNLGALDVAGWPASGESLFLSSFCPVVITRCFLLWCLGSGFRFLSGQPTETGCHFSCFSPGHWVPLSFQCQPTKKGMPILVLPGNPPGI